MTDHNMIDRIGKIDIERFTHNMHLRLKDRMCVKCSIHASRSGPSIRYDECIDCHEAMEGK